MFLLSTRSLAGYGLDHIFAITKLAGCDGIDLSVNFDEFDTMDSTYIEMIRERHGVPIVSITAPSRRVIKRHAEEILEFAQKLGIAIVNFYPPHRMDRDKEWFGE